MIKATTVTAIINNIKPSRVLMSSRIYGLALHCWRIRIVLGKSEEARLYGALDQSFGL